jgi:hypothetical protein
MRNTILGLLAIALCLLAVSAGEVKALDFELGRYFNPSYNGGFIFLDENSGVEAGIGADMPFHYVLRDGLVQITRDGEQDVLYQMKIISSKRIEVNGLALYHSTIAFPLEKIFTRDTLGQTIAYFEQTVGPARRFNRPDERQYVVEDCVFYVKGENSVESLILDPITPRCDFSLEPFGYGAAMASELRFDFFDYYRSDCLRLCGNSVNTTIFGVASGAHANDWIGFIGGIEDSDDSSRSFDQLIDIVAKNHDGQEIFYDGSFNKDNIYNLIIKEIFGNIKLNRIKVGQFLEETYF